MFCTHSTVFATVVRSCYRQGEKTLHGCIHGNPSEHIHMHQFQIDICEKDMVANKAYLNQSKVLGFASKSSETRYSYVQLLKKFFVAGLGMQGQSILSMGLVDS